MEIEYGLKLNFEREKKIRPLWNSLIKLTQILPFSDQCAIAAALIRSNLRRTGLPVGPYGVLIAGTALAYNLIVVTSNLKEFKRISEIVIEDWRV